MYAGLSFREYIGKHIPQKCHLMCQAMLIVGRADNNLYTFHDEIRTIKLMIVIYKITENITKITGMRQAVWI